MTSFYSSRGRLAWVPLVVLTVWSMTRGVISTRKTTRHSSRFAVNTTEVRKHEGLAELPSLGLVGSFELLGFQRGVPTDVGYADELISTNNEDFSGLQLESSPNAPPENRRIDPVLQNVEIPLEVRNTALKSKEIRALGLLLTTLRTLISKSVLRNIFLVLSSYYKLYSLFRACAVAYGLGFLFSKADQVANLANLLVTTLASLFLDSAKHNMYARLVSDLRLPNTVEQSLSGFMRRDKENLDSYTHSTVLENLKRSMVMVVRDYLDPQNVGDAIDQALVPSEPAAIQLIDFSTETISMDKFKADHPFIFLPHHVETPVHVFTSELRKPGTTYYKLLRSLQSIALPIFLGQSTSHWDSVVSHQIRPIMVEMGVKVQDLAISMMKARVHKLPNLLEWVNRDVDYRALVATDWVPLIGALSNWEAKDEMYSSHGLNWRDAARMKQMYLFFLQQAARISFLQRGIEQPVIRPGKSSCMSQFVARLQSTGSPRLKAMLDRVNLPYSFLTWELVNLCFIKGKDCSRLPLYFTSLKGTKLTLSVSEVAVPLEFELREPPNPQTAKILQSFPKTVRPMRSPFGYAGKGRPLSLQPAGLFARIRRGLVTRTKELLSPFLTLITLARQAWGRLIQRLKKAHGPKISMRIKPAKDAPEFLTITLEATGRVVQLVGRPLHMLQRIDPFQCEAGKEMKSYVNYFQEDETTARREGTPWEGLPANRVEVSYAKGKPTPRTRTTLSHVLRLLFPKNVVDTILDRFSNGESFQLTTAGGMQGTINFLREWHHTKKLLRSAYPEARDLEIQQDISEWHNPSRRNLEKMLRLNGVDGRPFKESWTVILNCSETAENVRWEVLDLDVPNQEQMVVKEYVQDFGELATLASAVEKELSLVAGVDHVLKRMQETFFDHAYKRMLYIESPGAFLQQLIDSDSQQIAREFEHWLLQRLQGNSRSKRCRPASFYGKAYAQYVALLAYYEKKDLTAPVPDLEEVKRFLLTASVPKGHLVRIPREEDSQHSGIYRMVERLDRCTFLLEDANRSQLATDASLHIVRSRHLKGKKFPSARMQQNVGLYIASRTFAGKKKFASASIAVATGFEDGDQISHQYVLRRQYKLIEKDATTGVCKVRDRHGYQFDLHSEETTPITIGQFAYQSSKLSKGTWVLSDSKAAYNTVIELKINYLTEFEVEQSIVQDCYTGIACIIRDDRDLPIMVHYAIPELATSAWTGPWLWLFLNGLHAEYLSIISSQLFVRSLEEKFWTQRTINELAHSCWELPEEASLSLDRKFLTPSSPTRLPRVLALFRRSRETNASVPNRCFASLENFEAFFPGASSGSELAPTNSAQLSFFQQTEQIVSKTAYAAYLLRKEREESAISGVKQHFRNRTCGPLCAAWWLKANELKSMVRRFSEAGQPPLTPQHEQFILAKALSTTPLGEYWTSRICTFQKSFRKLFTLLRLPYEQEATVPCSKMSAIIILATIMSDITLLIRRRAVTTGKQRVKNMEELLRFLKDNHVPVPCTYELPDAADLLNPTVPPDSEECMRRDIAANAFMRMKSLIDAAHVQVDDVIQEIRKRFTATLYSRLSPRFVSTSSEEYRHQAAEFRDVDEEVDDLFAALYRPFSVWQGTFKHRQKEEFLDMRMQQQCPFRPPQPTRHAKEVVPGVHVQLIQGYLPFGYNDSNIQDQSGFRQERTILLFTGLFLIQISARGTSFSNSVIQFVLEDGKAEESLKETAWPLLGLLLRQTVLVQSDPAATYELQCDALKNLRWGLKKLGLGSGEKTIQQVVQLFLEDANFAEVASFLPPPVEGFDTHAVPVGFLRFQSGQTPYSVLVTPSGDALFGSISERVERSGAQKRGSRSLVSVRVSEGILYVEDAVSEEIYRFDEPTECRPGSSTSVAVLRDVWKKSLPELDPGSPTKWRNVVTRHVDGALSQMGSTAECQSQRNYFIREVMKALSHNTPVQVGDKAWRGYTLVVVEKIEQGIKFVRPAVTLGEPQPPEATTEPIFSAEKITIGDSVVVSEGFLTYDLLDIALIGSVGCVSSLRRKDSGETVLSRKPLFRLSGFQQGELVRKSSSVEVYEYMGTCGNTFAIKAFVTGEMEWTTEDLMPLWEQIGRAYPQKELYMSLILVLGEFHRTEGSQISRIQFRKVLALLESYNRISASEKDSLQTTFDRRTNKESFYEAVKSVQQLAADLQADLQAKIKSSASTDIYKEMLFAWGSATLAALEAMWRGRSLWRMLHKIHQQGLAGFFAEINTLAQRPDLAAAINSINIDTLRELGQKAINDYVPASGASLLLPTIIEAVDQKIFQSAISKEAQATVDQFLNFVGDSVIRRRALTTLISSSPKEKALKMWEDYTTTVARRLEDFSTQQTTLDGYRKSLQSRDSILPQSGLNATWTDKIMLKLTEVIGSLMKKELGNKVTAGRIKSTLQPVILQELVDVSDLSFTSDSDKERVFGKLSEFLADQMSRLYQIQKPGRVPRGEVLLDALSLLEVDGSEVREVEERLRHQYSQLSQKYVDQLISAEVIDLEGVLDIIGKLENTLGTLLTPLIDRALGLVKKAAQVISRPRKKKQRFLFAFDALSASLEKIDTSVTPAAEESELLKAAVTPKLPGAVKPMKDMGSLKRIYTRFLAIGAGAVSTAGFHFLSKITGTLIPDHLVNVPLLFWTQLRAGALNTSLRTAFSRFIGPDAAPNIKLVQNSVWVSGVQPWVDSLKMQTAVLEQMLGKMEAGEPISRDWWKQLPLLVFIKRSLDTVRSSVFDPSTLHRIWSQIKFATSAPSGLYKVLMAPVKGLGSYLYLLFIELMNGLLPAENGDFLVPRELLKQEKGRPVMDIAVANPHDLIKYLHRLFDVLLKVYVPMVRELFDTGIQLVLQKLGYHISKDHGTLEVWRLINHIADNDVDEELEEILRELLFRIADDILRVWPAMPLGSPQPWQQM